MKNKFDFINKIHLVISVLIVVPVAFFYGISPSDLIDVHVNTNDEHSLFKGIMGFYLGFSLSWIYGIFKIQYLKSALVSNMVFMLGLGFGRLLSILFDGMPTLGYAFGTFGELVLGFYGLWVLKNKTKF